jgi:hypothetical protein
MLLLGEREATPSPRPREGLLEMRLDRCVLGRALRRTKATLVIRWYP